MRVFRQAEFWAVVASSAALAAGYLVAPAHDRFWPGLLLRSLYLPIVLAGFRYGLRGGLPVAAAAGLVFVLRAAAAPQMTAGWFELPLFVGVGAVSGALSDRQRRLNRTRRQAERQQALTELADGIAREVKEPLAAIRSSARMLADDADSRSAELAGAAVGGADRISRLVGDCLSYARPAALEFAPTRLSELLDSCIELLEPETARRRVEVMRHYPEAETSIYLDPKQMRRVFLNLLSNALQASPDNGRVVCRIETAGREVRASVRDFGPGIPADRLDRVFEPFFSTRKGGTGLGLSIARRIVAEHGGGISLENAEGRGLIATVILPAG